MKKGEEKTGQRTSQNVTNCPFLTNFFFILQFPFFCYILPLATRMHNTEKTSESLDRKKTKKKNHFPFPFDLNVYEPVIYQRYVFSMFFNFVKKMGESSPSQHENLKMEFPLSFQLENKKKSEKLLFCRFWVNVKNIHRGRLEYLLDKIF